jgi:hypothetical protein
LSPPIPLPAAFVLFSARWPLLTITERFHAVAANAYIIEIFSDGRSTLVSQGDVVRLTAAFIGVAFDQNAYRWV